MANEQIIDQVIAPVADEQVISLTKLLKDLDVVMAADIKTANQLNSALANAKTFSEYSKGAASAAIQLEKVNQAQLKTQQLTIKTEEINAKAAAAQKLRDEQAAQRLAQQEARQAAADAKQIAAEEAKAAKLQAIAEKQQRTTRDFPNGQSSPNPVTTDDSPAVRYEPIITGNEDMSATAIKSTEAIAEENAALLEQQEVLGSLTTAQRANIETLLALQAERTANATELKALNVEDAASGERAVFLTAEQIRLNQAIRSVTVELNAQSKQANATKTSIDELTVSNDLLRMAYYNNMTAEERASAEGVKMLETIKANDLAMKEMKLATGQTNVQVGDYEKGIGKASAATVIAEKVSAQFVRQLVRMAAQFLLISVAIGAITWIFDYIKGLVALNSTIDSTVERADAMKEALTSSGYTKAIESVVELGANIDMAKDKMSEQSRVVDEYNKTIGTITGSVDSFTEAEKGFQENSDKYIEAMLKQAAATVLANKAAKDFEDTQDFIQDKQALIDMNNQDIKAIQKNGLPNASGAPTTDKSVSQVVDDLKKQNKGVQDEIDSANNKLKLRLEARQRIMKEMFESIVGAGGDTTGDGNTKPAAIDALKNDIANQALERDRTLAQKQIGNEKLSYATREKAVMDFYAATAQIAKNNETLATKNVKLSADQKLKIEGDYSKSLLDAQISRDTQLQSLKDKAYKQDQQHLKNNLEAQRDLFKQIVDDPNQSYNMKLIALEQYNKRADALNKAVHKEAITEAGKNGKAITLANDEFAKADLERKQYISDETIKIQKEAFAKIKEQSSESQQDQLDILDRGSKQALEALDKHKNDLINAKTAERDAGKIGEKQYTHDLLLINDEYNVKRIAAEIQTQAAILGIKEAHRDSTVFQMQQDGATPEDIAKFTKGANKGIQATQDTMSGLQNQYDDANSKYKSDKGKPVGKDSDEARKKIEEETARAITDSIDNIDKLRQKAYENEIARLEKLGEQIDINANNEKLQVQDSIASNETKAREIRVIENQAAAQHLALQARINKEKHKADVAEKEATIAKIIVNGALAVVSAFATQPAWLGIALGAIVSASVGIELATAIATKLPTYAEGGKWKPGLGLWGEAGIERANLPDGSVRYSNGPEVTSFPMGTVITPHMELMQQIKPEPVKFVGAEQVPWREFHRELKRMNDRPNRRNRFNINVNMDFELYKQQYFNGKA